MASTKIFRQLGLSFPNTEESPHFERTFFRVKRKIFATLDVNTGIDTLKLSKQDQRVFGSINKSAIYPVSNKWGGQTLNSNSLQKSWY